MSGAIKGRFIDVGSDDFDRDFHLSQMRAEMEKMKWWFPSPEEWVGAESINSRSFSNFKLPVHARLIEDPVRDREICAEVLERLLNLLPQIVANRPLECPYAEVLGLVEWPSLFWSEVCVCFTPEKAQMHAPESYGKPSGTERRFEDDGSWYEAWQTDETPFNALGVDLPRNVTVGGYKVRRYDADLDETFCEQFWSIRPDHQTLESTRA